MISPRENNCKLLHPCELIPCKHHKLFIQTSKWKVYSRFLSKLVKFISAKILLWSVKNVFSILMFSSIENNFTGFNFLQSVQNVLIILKSHDCIFINLFHEYDVLVCSWSVFVNMKQHSFLIRTHFIRTLKRGLGKN